MDIDIYKKDRVVLWEREETIEMTMEDLKKTLWLQSSYHRRHKKRTRLRLEFRFFFYHILVDIAFLAAAIMIRSNFVHPVARNSL